jgi:hypothetical protein
VRAVGVHFKPLQPVVREETFKGVKPANAAAQSTRLDLKFGPRAWTRKKKTIVTVQV